MAAVSAEFFIGGIFSTTAGAAERERCAAVPAEALSFGISEPHCGQCIIVVVTPSLLAQFGEQRLSIPQDPRYQNLR